MIATLLALPLVLAQEPASAPPVAPPPAQEVPATSVAVEVRLSDGQTLRGTVDPAILLAWRAGESLGMRVGTGPDILLPAGQVVSVETLEATGRPPTRQDTISAASSRNFFAPTAIPLPAGRGYVSQMEVLATIVDYGVTDWLTVEAGTSVPLALFSLTMGGPDALNGLIGMVGGKAAVRLAPRLHVAAGGFGVVSPDFQVGLPFGVATLGDEDRNVTVGGGAVFATELDEWMQPVVVAGTWRIRPGLGLVTENWILFDDGEFFGVLDTLGVRFLPERGRWSVDLAVASIASESDWMILPAPWLDVSWHFGG